MLFDWTRSITEERYFVDLIWSFLRVWQSGLKFKWQTLASRFNDWLEFYSDLLLHGQWESMVFRSSTFTWWIPLQFVGEVIRRPMHAHSLLWRRESPCYHAIFLKELKKILRRVLDVFIFMSTEASLFLDVLVNWWRNVYLIVQVKTRIWLRRTQNLIAEVLICIEQSGLVLNPSWMAEGAWPALRTAA